MYTGHTLHWATYIRILNITMLCSQAREEKMGSGSQVFNQVRLSRAEASSLHSDIYKLYTCCLFLLDNKPAKHSSVIQRMCAWHERERDREREREVELPRGGKNIPNLNRINKCFFTTTNTLLEYSQLQQCNILITPTKARQCFITPTLAQVKFTMF